MSVQLDVDWTTHGCPLAPCQREDVCRPGCFRRSNPRLRNSSIVSALSDLFLHQASTCLLVFFADGPVSREVIACLPIDGTSKRLVVIIFPVPCVLKTLSNWA